MARRSNEELWAAHQTPRKKGEGSVFFVQPTATKKGFYRATRTISWDPVTRRANQVTGSGRTEEEAIARREANVTKALVRAGKLSAAQLPLSAKDTARTFETVVLEWVKWKQSLPMGAGGIRDVTLGQYTSLIKLHIVGSPLGTMPLRLIERRHVRDYLYEYLPGLTRTAYRHDLHGNVVGTEIVERLGPSNKRALQGIINMTLKYAQMERNYIENNPADGVRPIPKANDKGRAEETERYKYVAKNLALHIRGDDNELRWLLAISTGARQMEILSLTWDKFRYLLDEQKQTPRVFISHQLRRAEIDGKKTWRLEQQVKTPSSHRVIALDSRIVEVIKRYREDIQGAWKRDTKKWRPLQGLENLVFTLPNGRPVTPTLDNKRYRETLRRFGLPYVRQHWLRHFAASTMVANGANIEAVAAILGHGSVSVTRAVYVHDDLRPMIEPIKGLVDAMFRDRDRGTIEEWDEYGPVGQGGEL